MLRLVVCDCLRCGGGIEFDASDFTEGEHRTVDCPHCNRETSIYVQRESPVSIPSDTRPEIDPLTPKLFSDFIGQSRVKERLEIAIQAAKQRGEALSHIL
jgi:hypothetical protein